MDNLTGGTSALLTTYLGPGSSPGDSNTAPSQKNRRTIVLITLPAWEDIDSDEQPARSALRSSRRSGRTRSLFRLTPTLKHLTSGGLSRRPGRNAGDIEAPPAASMLAGAGDERQELKSMNGINNTDRQDVDNADIHPECHVCPEHYIYTEPSIGHRYSYCGDAHASASTLTGCPQGKW